MFVLACTDPAKVLNVSASKQIVEVLGSVSLQCTAEGNPFPNYTWRPCNKQECRKSILDVSNIRNDDVYVCTVANYLGSDSGNDSVCKLQKNFSQLTYSTWDFCHFYTIRLSVILTAIILCTSPVNFHDCI